MKVKDIKAGEVFTIDSSFVRPKLKLNKGFIDMVSHYIYENKEDVIATICTESELKRIISNLRITPEGFEIYRQKIIKKYLCEELKNENKV